MWRFSHHILNTPPTFSVQSCKRLKVNYGEISISNWNLLCWIFLCIYIYFYWNLKCILLGLTQVIDRKTILNIKDLNFLNCLFSTFIPYWMKKISNKFYLCNFFSSSIKIRFALLERVWIKIPLNKLWGRAILGHIFICTCVYIYATKNLPVGESLYFEEKMLGWDGEKRWKWRSKKKKPLTSPTLINSCFIVYFLSRRNWTQHPTHGLLLLF